MIVDLLVLTCTAVPFFVMFRNQRPRTERVVIVTMVTTLKITNEDTFFVVKDFGPVTTVIVVAKISLNNRTKFLYTYLVVVVSGVFFKRKP